MGQLLDYCSHFKLSGFAMVEHRDAGSWQGKPCFPSGGVMVFSGGSLSSTRVLVQRLQMEPPMIIPQGVRGVEWSPGWLRKASVVSHLSNLWLPDWGLGM